MQTSNNIQRKRITLVNKDNFTKQDVNISLTSVQGYIDDLVREVNSLRSGKKNEPDYILNQSGPSETLDVNIKGKSKSSEYSDMSEDSRKLGGLEAIEYATKEDLKDSTYNVAKDSEKLNGIPADRYLLKSAAPDVKVKNAFSSDSANTLIDNAQIKNVISSGNVTSETLSVNGKSTLKGDLSVEGDIYQKGSMYETHAEDFYTTKDLITTRDGAKTPLPDDQLTGIIANHYDNDGNNGALGFDKNGIARVGDVKITVDPKTKEKTVDISKTQAIATRENLPLNGGLAIWNQGEVGAEVNRFDTILPKDITAGLASDLVDEAEIGKVGVTDNSVVNKKFITETLASMMDFKGILNLISELPPNKNKIGDTYYVKENIKLYIWEGSKWVDIATNVDITQYYNKNDIDDKLKLIKNGTDPVTKLGNEAELDKSGILPTSIVNKELLDTSLNGTLVKPIDIKKNDDFHNLPSGLYKVNWEDGLWSSLINKPTTSKVLSGGFLSVKKTEDGTALLYTETQSADLFADVPVSSSDQYSQTWGKGSAEWGVWEKIATTKDVKDISYIKTSTKDLGINRKEMTISDLVNKLIQKGASSGSLVYFDFDVSEGCVIKDDSNNIIEITGGSLYIGNLAVLTELWNTVQMFYVSENGETYSITGVLQTNFYHDEDGNIYVNEDNIPYTDGVEILNTNITRLVSIKDLELYATKQELPNIRLEGTTLYWD